MVANSLCNIQKQDDGSERSTPKFGWRSRKHSLDFPNCALWVCRGARMKSISSAITTLGISGSRVKALMIGILYHNVMVINIWLVVSTPLKNTSQVGSLFPTYGKIKNVPNHQSNIVITNNIMNLNDIPSSSICNGKSPINIQIPIGKSSNIVKHHQTSSYYKHHTIPSH